MTAGQVRSAPLDVAARPVGAVGRQGPRRVGSLAAALLSLLLLVPAPTRAGSFPWHPKSLDDALAVAQREGKLVVVDVYAEWCEPCKRLERLVFGSPELLALAPRFIGVRIDGDKPAGKPVTRRYHVEKYPTSLMLRPDGTEWGRIEGFRELPGYLETLRAFLDGRSPGAPAAAGDEPLVTRFAGAFRRARTGDATAEQALAQLEDEDAGGLAGVRDAATLARGELLLALGRHAEARRLLEPLVARVPPALAEDVAYALARALAAGGDPRGGARLLERRVRKAPDPNAAAWRLARFCVTTEGAPRDGALRVVEGLSRRSPTDVALLDALSSLHERAGRYDAALDATNRAVAVRPDLPWYRQRVERLTELRGVAPGGPP